MHDVRARLGRIEAALLELTEGLLRGGKQSANGDASVSMARKGSKNAQDPRASEWKLGMLGLQPQAVSDGALLRA